MEPITREEQYLDAILKKGGGGGSGPSPSSETPKMDGTASAGSSSAYSRGDHVHPKDTSKQDKITVVGLLLSDGSTISAAEAGVDYVTPSALTGFVAASEKGAANGLATLDADGHLTAEQTIAKRTTINSDTQLSGSHMGCVIVNSNLAVTITVPYNSSDFPVGGQVVIWQKGFGAVTILGQQNVVFRMPDGSTIRGGSFTIEGQNGNVSLYKDESALWFVSGAVA